MCVVEDIFCRNGIAHGTGLGWSFARFEVALAWGQTMRGPSSQLPPSGDEGGTHNDVIGWRPNSVDKSSLNTAELNVEEQSQLPTSCGEAVFRSIAAVSHHHAHSQPDQVISLQQLKS